MLQDTWDDDYGFVPAEVGDPVVNRSSASWDPSAINPRASSVDDLLKFGLARLIDAKTRPVRPENTAPVLAAEGNPGPRVGANGGTVGLIAGVPTWLWLVGGGVAAWLAYRNL